MGVNIFQLNFLFVSKLFLQFFSVFVDLTLGRNGHLCLLQGS